MLAVYPLRVLALSGALAISGCATQWHNPYIPDDLARSQQLKIDDGYCIQAAAGSVPIPEPRVYTQERSTYVVQGVATTYGSGRPTATHYTGTVYQQPSTNLAASFASGFNIGDAIAASHNRKLVYTGCMTSLGWTTDKELALQIAQAEQQKTGEKQDRGRQVQQEIDSIPELAEWQRSDPGKWDLAVSIDNTLKNDPSYAFMPLRDRLLLVVQRVKEAAR